MSNENEAHEKVRKALPVNISICNICRIGKESSDDDEMS
jgi:hypothetical protein